MMGSPENVKGGHPSGPYYSDEACAANGVSGPSQPRRRYYLLWRNGCDTSVPYHGIVTLFDQVPPSWAALDGPHAHPSRSRSSSPRGYERLVQDDAISHEPTSGPYFDDAGFMPEPPLQPAVVAPKPAPRSKGLNVQAAPYMGPGVTLSMLQSSSASSLLRKGSLGSTPMVSKRPSEEVLALPISAEGANALPDQQADEPQAALDLSEHEPVQEHHVVNEAPAPEQEPDVLVAPAPAPKPVPTPALKTWAQMAAARSAPKPVAQLAPAAGPPAKAAPAPSESQATVESKPKQEPSDVQASSTSPSVSKPLFIQPDYQEAPARAPADAVVPSTKSTGATPRPSAAPTPAETPKPAKEQPQLEQEKEQEQPAQTDKPASPKPVSPKPASPAPAPAKPAKPTSWAAMVKVNEPAKPAGPAGAGDPSVNGPITTRVGATPTEQDATRAVRLDDDPTRLVTMGELVHAYNPQYAGPSVLPRGLVNNGNMCFLNVILQPLVHCPPFHNLMRTISRRVTHSMGGKTQLIESFVSFFKEYVGELANKDGKDERNGRRAAGTATPDEAAVMREPLLPEGIYGVMRTQCKMPLIKGRQEDAEEFLGFLLDGLHSEFVAATKPAAPAPQAGARAATPVGAPNGAPSANGDGEWLEVGHKHRTSVTRSVNVQESPVTSLFGGRIRSTLKVPGHKDSVTIEPFQSLQLDITPDHVDTVKDALRELMEPEIIEEYPAGQGAVVEATKQAHFERVPPILVLHLKRFLYDHNLHDTVKISKHVAVPATLELENSLFAHRPRLPSLTSTAAHHAALSAGRFAVATPSGPAAATSTPVSPTSGVADNDAHLPATYRLFAVINHHGRTASGGHYTCDVLESESRGTWLRMDDMDLARVRAADVLARQPDRDPYLLFFERRPLVQRAEPTRLARVRAELEAPTTAAAGQIAAAPSSAASSVAGAATPASTATADGVGSLSALPSPSPSPTGMDASGEWNTEEPFRVVGAPKTQKPKKFPPPGVRRGGHARHGSHGSGGRRWS